MAWSTVLNSLYYIDSAWKSLKLCFSCLHTFATEIPLIFFPFTTESYSFVSEQKQKTLLREFLCPQSLKAAKLSWSFHSAAQAAASRAETPIAHVLGLCSPSTFHRSHSATNQGNEINPTIQHQSGWEGNAELLIHTLWKPLSNVMITISTFLIGFHTVNFVYVNRAIYFLCSSLLQPSWVCTTIYFLHTTSTGFALLWLLHENFN